MGRGGKECERGWGEGRAVEKLQALRLAMVGKREKARGGEEVTEDACALLRLLSDVM